MLPKKRKLAAIGIGRNQYLHAMELDHVLVAVADLALGSGEIETRYGLTFGGGRLAPAGGEIVLGDDPA